MQLDKLKDIFSKTNNLKIAVIGDLMVDEYIWGDVQRICPEAPVQVVDVIKEEFVLGGAANVVNNLCSLGCKVSVISVVGNDENASILKELLKKIDCDTKGLYIEKGRKTTLKTKIIAVNQQVLRIDKETRDLLSEEYERKILDFIKKGISNYDAILVSDYGKGIITKRIIQGVVEIANKNSIPVIVDPKGKDFLKYKNATVVKPNKKECEIAAGVSITDKNSFNKAGKKLLNSLNLEALIVTAGAEGIVIFEKGKEPLYLSTEAKEIYDVTGAGDTVLATLGLGIASGLSYAESAKLSNIAAGIVVGKVGTSSISQDEIIHYVETHQPYNIFKIKSLDELKKIVKMHRSNGKTIVFTNGCFDLLHLGHIKLLQMSKRYGDILIVGINSDKSVRRLKGDARPFIQEKERAHILSALDSVDYVTIFNEDTPVNLLRELKPDFLTKGGDYKLDEVVGKDLIESYGGKAIVIDAVKGISISKMVDDIRSKMDNN